MATHTDRFSSDYLPKEQIQAALVALPAVLRQLVGDCQIIASYGWATNIHYDLMYLPMRVGTTWMERFIENSIDQRIVVPGGSDFRFTVPDDRLDVLFCHESDIHVNGKDDDLIHQFRATDPFARIRFRSREEVQESS